MATISSSLESAAGALDSYQYALGVTQNNIDNSTTPGYARQQVVLQADGFDPSSGLAGGVSPGPLVNSRDILSEKDVWQQSSAQGDSSAQSSALAAIQNALPVGANAGIPAALNTFFNNVSAWSASPNDSGVQQAVMNSASSLAQSFQTTAAQISQESQSVSQSIVGTVGQINQLTTQLANFNAQVQNGGQHDAGLQANMYNTIQTLSSLVNINVIPQSDGTMQVTLSAGDALVMGANSYALTAGSATPPANSADPQAPPDAAILGADGADVTRQITSGTLHGFLQVRNVTIPGLIGDPSQPGAINLLASTLATRVNQIVSQGSVSAGVPAPSGLFTFNAASPSAAASTLAVDPNMTASQLPPIDQNGVPNGVPLALNNLASPTNAADEVQGVSYTAFYGNTAGIVGSAVDQAQTNQSLSTQSLAQAQSTRQTAQGVSLDAEAVNVLQYQAGYQAIAKVVTTLESLTQALIGMMPS